MLSTGRLHSHWDRDNNFGGVCLRQNNVFMKNNNVSKKSDKMRNRRISMVCLMVSLICIVVAVAAGNSDIREISKALAVIWSLVSMKYLSDAHRESHATHGRQRIIHIGQRRKVVANNQHRPESQKDYRTQPEYN